MGSLANSLGQYLQVRYSKPRQVRRSRGHQVRCKDFHQDLHNKGPRDRRSHDIGRRPVAAGNYRYQIPGSTELGWIAEKLLLKRLQPILLEVCEPPWLSKSLLIIRPFILAYHHWGPDVWTVSGGIHRIWDYGEISALELIDIAVLYFSTSYVVINRYCYHVKASCYAIDKALHNEYLIP